jgi:hypothetical protein
MFDESFRQIWEDIFKHPVLQPLAQLLGIILAVEQELIEH